ncbi:MAG: LysE family translocator [Pseudomonadota bacterium]
MAVNALAYTGLAVGVIGTPGPANMILLATGARYGLRRALPFVAGVALGKQFVIWPVGLGLMSLMVRYPAVFDAMRWASAAYILWLAWTIAGTRLSTTEAGGDVPGFAQGLIVHPLNPKAWALMVAGFTNYVEPGTSALVATATLAAITFGVQAISHPIWCAGGAQLARLVQGTRYERALMILLALLTVASVLLVLAKG